MYCSNRRSGCLQPVGKPRTKYRSGPGWNACQSNSLEKSTFTVKPSIKFPNDDDDDLDQLTFIRLITYLAAHSVTLFASSLISSFIIKSEIQSFLQKKKEKLSTHIISLTQHCDAELKVAREFCENKCSAPETGLMEV